MFKLKLFMKICMWFRVCDRKEQFNIKYKENGSLTVLLRLWHVTNVFSIWVVSDSLMPVFNKYPIIINYLFLLQVETFYCQPFSQRTMTLFKKCVVGFCMLFVFVICLYSFVVPIQNKVWIYNYLLLQNNSRVDMSDVIDVNQTESLMGTKIPNMTNHLKSVQTDCNHIWICW